MLPTPGVGVVEIAVQDIARHFVVEAHIVIAHNTGFGHGKQGVNAGSKRCFVLSFFTRFLRGNTGDKYRFRVRQIVVRRLAIKNLWIADNVEIVIRADGRKLRGPVQRRMGTKGFVIVEEKRRVLLAVIHCSVMSGINLALL